MAEHMSVVGSHQKQKRLPGCMIPFFGIFAFAGFAVMIGAGIMPLVNGEDDLGQAIFALIFSLPFIGIGAGGIFVILRQRRSNPLSGLDEQAQETRDANYNYASPEQLGLDQELELKASSSPVARTIVILIFALIWNGITSIPIIQEVIPGFQSGDIDWGLTIFMSLFALVGLALIGGFVYSFLALKNPRPQLCLHTSQPRLGQPLKLQMDIPGDTHRIANLRITIKGNESATYRRGTDTVTSTELFYEADICEIMDSVDMRSGHFTFTIPANLMPSWKADNNEITWQIELKGDIPHWPDISETYELTVYPELRR